MVMVAPVGYPLGYSINMLLGLVLFNSFDTWEGYLVRVSLGTLARLIIVTREGSLVVLSLLISIGFPLESPNPGDELPGTLLGAPIGLWFGSEAVRCLCSCIFLVYNHEDNLWGVGISFVLPYRYFITYTMNSVSYFQLLGLLTLSLSPTWLMPTSGGR